MTILPRWLLVTALCLALAAPASAGAPPPSAGPEGAATTERPGLTTQTRARERRKLPMDATERSLRESIDNQRTIIELTDRRDPSYPMQVIALADFHWDLAEWLGLQAHHEEIDRGLFEAEERGDEAAIRRFAQRKQSLLDRQSEYRARTITAYRQVIRDFPTSPRLDEIRYFLAYNLTEMGRADEGVDVYTELIGAHPASPYVPDAIVNIGEHYFEQNDFASALKLYSQVEKFPDAPILGYAVYKQAWCLYNLADYRLSLSKFLQVLKLAEESALAGRRGAIQLRREAETDMLLPYAKVGRAGEAIKFLQTYAPERYLDLAGRLASIYTEQSEFMRSTQLLRALIAEARKGAIAGRDQSHMVVQFQRQIVDNAMRSNDKEATVAEIGELMRSFEETRTGPTDFLQKEQEEAKRLILDIAHAYHTEFSRTQERQTLEYTQRLYHEYLRVFREDENAYEIAMNNARLLQITEKFEEAAAAYERVIRMDPEGEFADEAAERAVVAYLRLIQIEDQQIKSEVTDDLTRLELSSEEQRFVGAIDRWMAIVERRGPNPETANNIPAARFGAAKVLYNANHFKESAERFLAYLQHHPNHDYVNDARRHVMSAFNLSHDVDNLIRYANEFDAIADLPSDIRKDIHRVRNELNYQECFKFQNRSEHVAAAECFERYARDFPREERAAAAIYNAGINYFEARQVERALQIQLDLYRDYRTNELAPRALYAMGEMFRQTAVYDEAAKVYEAFVANHRGHPLEERALRLASIFRKTLGDHRQAIANMNLWLQRFGDQPSAPAVNLDIIKILELQERHPQVVTAVNAHIRRFANETPSTRLQVLNIRGRAQQANRRFREANAAFEETVRHFSQLPEEQAEDLSIDAISAVAEAHFNLGETHLRNAQRVKLDAPDEKRMERAIQEKMEAMNAARTMYEQVIAYGHPGWAIAAWSQLGLAFQDFADAVENAAVPARIRHLPEVVDAWEQMRAEQAKNIRDRALDAYRRALEVAKRERWFNEYSERAEQAIAQLDLTDLTVREFRVRPAFLNPNSGTPTFLGSGVTLGGTP